MAFPRIALIHATPLAIAPINEAFDRVWPRADRMHLLDDSLSADRAGDGALTDRMTERFVRLATYAKFAGAEGILFTCSAFGPAIEAAARAVAIPTLRPNEAMFERALAAGRRIGLVATFEPSLAPMRVELDAMAARRTTPIELATRFVPDAMDALGRGDPDEHNRLVAQSVAQMNDCEVIMLAQFSMAGAQALAQGASTARVLTSPQCAVEALHAALVRSAGA